MVLKFGVMPDGANQTQLLYFFEDQLKKEIIESMVQFTNDKTYSSSLITGRLDRFF
ncbi:hypothetical protein [Gracilibacillus ureilyticus]|uniref:hypothetical protein n=1 Tax=Gracilibacillus ureilyticus TaxID=531814 RepID=UPI001587ED1E|nr:hypothetical protein [Gracilibacillus ureilyticus]